MTTRVRTKHAPTRWWVAVFLSVAAAPLLTLSSSGNPAPSGPVSPGFDHMTTGFELTGAHRELTCESCHAGGVFDATPRDCSACHTGTGRLSAPGKPARHVLSSDRCEGCHSVDAFVPVVRMEHAEVRGSCGGCHNGIAATGKSPAHIASDDDCESCHTTIAWTPARFDHVNVAPGTCSSCHNGVRATGKPMDHVPTTAECDACHGTLAWQPAGIDHSAFTGNCQSCHDGAGATGKNAGHLVTTLDCVSCHRYPSWSPHTFRHTSANYPGDHRGAPACNRCHTSNSEALPWPFPAYAPHCAGCHAGDFESGPHNKTAAGVKYTAAELGNCSGACHVYTDTTMTVISRPRPGPEHRASDGDF